MAETIIRGGTILTIDPDWRVLSGDIACRDGEIVHIGGDYTPESRDYEILDAEGCVVMPGLVQTHIHMVQTLARGRADDLELLDWLRKVVWPYEAALESDDVAACARLSCAELLRSGTTCVLDMATVRHTERVFEVARDAGIRATIGKIMMDAPDLLPGLREDTRASLDESAALCQRWHGVEDGRLRYAYTPRFALSCTEELLRASVHAARAAGVLIHTHASENRDEIEEVRQRTGKDNIDFLHGLGLSGPDVLLAHCVWLSESDERLLRDTGTHVLHCPSSNAKLGSGIARIAHLRDMGISVSIGADGAPCNNNLDGLFELRLAVLLQKAQNGARVLPASQAVRMATLDGARALGLGDRIGSLEAGKRADIIVVDLDNAHTTPWSDPYSAVVYAARSSDVRHVVVDGRVLVRDRDLLTLDAEAAIADGAERSRRIFARM